MIVILTFGCSMETNNNNKNNNSDSCNNESATGYSTITHNNISREYIIHIPDTYNSNENYPLVINFHGNGDCANTYSNLVADLRSEANAGPFILAYPQGISRTKGAAEWDPTNNAEQNINNNDIFFVEQLIENIRNTYSINPQKIYAVGYSNGGMLAYGLACHKGNMIAAIGVMSGIMLVDTTCNTNYFTSVIHMHGQNDFVLPYSGNRDFSSVESVVDFWLNHNGIDNTNITTTQFNGGNIVKNSYTGGQGNTIIDIYTINDGEHVWFNQLFDDTESNTILWNFLIQIQGTIHFKIKKYLKKIKL